ncbi:hypothetical protein L596_005635 [Steinernema carpocapsae]|uniref:Mediator of RNA polymerase II transcription subunit 20 n=1 Tax=Steinernema carpocapsae TaxID=34508 RepID=A0A4V6I8I8_STECR|nr:hypothetical protein L596_005635 [Steinernema carpocapsae]
MVGVSWVFGMQNTLKEVEAIVENFHAVSVGNYKVDCVPYNPTECVEGKNIQGCFLLHHSYCPDSSFTLFAPLNAKKPIAASSDRDSFQTSSFLAST